jgi:hypothetical protein
MELESVAVVLHIVVADVVEGAVVVVVGVTLTEGDVGKLGGCLRV